MTLPHIDLSERQGHRANHGFACGAEFDVRIHGRPVSIPDFVRERLSESEIDELWWEEANRSKEELQSDLQRRHKWVGQLVFVGRGPGWLALEDTSCRRRNWDAIGKIVEQRLAEFVASMEDADTWRDIRGVEPVSVPTPAPAPAKKSAVQLRSEVEATVGRHGRRGRRR